MSVQFLPKSNSGIKVLSKSSFDLSTKLPGMVYMIGEYPFPSITGGSTNKWYQSTYTGYNKSDGWFAINGSSGNLLYLWNKFTNQLIDKTVT